MSTARSTPAWSRCSRKALGDLQNSMIWPKFDRFFFISSSAWGLNISMGWMWMWQSVIKLVVGRQSLVVSRWSLVVSRCQYGGHKTRRGRLIIAQHLSAGQAAEKRTRPAETTETCKEINFRPLRALLAW